MRPRKRELLNQLSADAQSLIDENGGGVRNWLAAPLNNAQLVSSNLYEGRVAAFRMILGNCSDDIGCFYERTAGIADLPAEDRVATLNALSD
jgi:predicted aminopeptidase